MIGSRPGMAHLIFAGTPAPVWPHLATSAHPGPTWPSRTPAHVRKRGRR
jgi:hypothetical protein